MANGGATSGRVEAAATPPMLHRIVSAGHLRYWVIASWGVALATEVRLDWVGVWFAVTMALGLTRGAVDARAGRLKPANRRIITCAVATASCLAWAAAPLLAWIEGVHYGEALAVGLLAAGYTLVFTQMRAAPGEAMIVSSPYTVVLIYMIADSAAHPGFWTLAALAPVLALALLIKVIVTQIKDREMSISDARQAALIRDLEEARDRADAASTAKSNFLGVISHELRTPMNGVLGAAQLLEAGDLRPDQRNFVGIIRQSGESLLALLNDILDITKIEAGRMEIEVVEVSMADLHQRLIGPFQAQARAKGLILLAECPQDAPHLVRTDPLRLGQIVQNFLSNAIKFTGAGEVRLTVRTVRLSDTRASLCFTVEDEGVGIAEDDLARLFQPFTQVDASSTRRFSGTGLGLSIAKRMAELLGGKVEVTSRVGEGSRFSVTVGIDVLAWARPVEHAATTAAGEPSGPGRSLDILVAEDHPVNRLLLENFLTSLGHRVICVEDGAAALEQACLRPFDLVVMDVNMPVMDGLTAIREVRKTDGPNQQVPIVVLSASARSEDHDLGLEAGADAYLDKPIDFKALVGVLEIAGPRDSASGRRLAG